MQSTNGDQKLLKTAILLANCCLLVTISDQKCCLLCFLSVFLAANRVFDCSPQGVCMGENISQQTLIYNGAY